MASPPPVEDQARLLEDALAVVRQQTMLMRRCLETPGKLMDALKCRYELPQNDTTYMGHRRI
jgi:vacuolar protein sorting-associated protein 35